MKRALIALVAMECRFESDSLGPRDPLGDGGGLRVEDNRLAIDLAGSGEAAGA